RLELDLDVRILGLEGRDDLLLPDRQVVIAPALDHEFGGAGRSQAGASQQQGRQRQEGTARNGHRGFSREGMVRHAIGRARRRSPRASVSLERASLSPTPSIMSTASLMSLPARSQAAAAV